MYKSVIFYSNLLPSRTNFINTIMIYNDASYFIIQLIIIIPN